MISYNGVVDTGKVLYSGVIDTGVNDTAERRTVAPFTLKLAKQKVEDLEECNCNLYSGQFLRRVGSRLHDI